MDSTPSLARPTALGRLRRHTEDPLYRMGYLLIAGAGITSLLGFVFWILAARSYPARVVGANSAAISAMMFVSGVCQLGLPAVLVRYIPTAGGGTRKLVKGSLLLTAGLSLALGAAAALTSGLWSPSLRFLARDASWLADFVLATTAWTLFSLQDGVLTGLRVTHWVPVKNAIFAATKLALLFALTGLSPFAGPFLAWNVPGVLVVIGFMWLIFRRLLPAGDAPDASAELDSPRLLKLAAGNYLAQLFGIAAIFVMPIVVADVTNATTTAYFYVPWTLALALLLVCQNTASALTVEAALDEDQLGPLFRRSLAHTLWLLVPLVAVVIIGAPILLSAYGPKYAHAGAPLMRLLALGAFPNVFVTLCLAVARIHHRGRAVLGIQAAECVPLIALSIVLLHTDGLVGVGWAYLGSQWAVAIWLSFTSLRPLFR